MDQSYAPFGWAGGSLNKSAMERLVGNLVGNELTLIGMIIKRTTKATARLRYLVYDTECNAASRR